MMQHGKILYGRVIFRMLSSYTFTKTRIGSAGSALRLMAESGFWPGEKWRKKKRENMTGLSERV